MDLPGLPGFPPRGADAALPEGFLPDLAPDFGAPDFDEPEAFRFICAWSHIRMNAMSGRITGRNAAQERRFVRGSSRMRAARIDDTFRGNRGKQKTRAVRGFLVPGPKAIQRALISLISWCPGEDSNHPLPPLCRGHASRPITLDLPKRLPFHAAGGAGGSTSKPKYAQFTASMNSRGSTPSWCSSSTFVTAANGLLAPFELW